MQVIKCKFFTYKINSEPGFFSTLQDICWDKRKKKKKESRKHMFGGETHTQSPGKKKNNMMKSGHNRHIIKQTTSL